MQGDSSHLAGQLGNSKSCSRQLAASAAFRLPCDQEAQTAALCLLGHSQGDLHVRARAVYSCVFFFFFFFFFFSVRAVVLYHV